MFLDKIDAAGVNVNLNSAYSSVSVSRSFALSFFSDNMLIMALSSSIISASWSSYALFFSLFSGERSQLHNAFVDIYLIMPLSRVLCKLRYIMSDFVC